MRLPNRRIEHQESQQRQLVDLRGPEAIGDAGGTDRMAAVLADYLQRFTTAEAGRNDILHHQHTLARGQCEPTPQLHNTFDALREARSQPQGSPHFMSDDQTTEGGRHNHFGGLCQLVAAELGELRSESLGDVRMLKGASTL